MKQNIYYLLCWVNTGLNNKLSGRCMQPVPSLINVFLAIRTKAPYSILNLTLWKWAVPKKTLAQFQIKHTVVKLKSARKAGCIIRMFKY